MKTFYFIAIIGVIFASSCSRQQFRGSDLSKNQLKKVHATDNFFANESHKIISTNAKNKEVNQQAAIKKQKEEAEKNNELNKRTISPKKKRAAPPAFNFYF